MPKEYDPVLCMVVDKPAKAKDEDVKLFQTIAEKNGYGVYVVEAGKGKKIVLTFPGETYKNPHMWLGEFNIPNMMNAQHIFQKLAFAKGKGKDASAIAGFVKQKIQSVHTNRDFEEAMGLIKSAFEKGEITSEQKRQLTELLQKKRVSGVNDSAIDRAIQVTDAASPEAAKIVNQALDKINGIRIDLSIAMDHAQRDKNDKMMTVIRKMLHALNSIDLR